ncbi:Dfp1/Him1, central region-domain-containing protein [Boletus edulis BED1]|uniref:Dfp1/Him1, central region-domain-containing protein n=1 Tax=Boletus edulis BED1 TaxID=1328754 RepID=A0AAD4GHP5_BOLED|nr:Dfp1/Him1, central region-domain-containing protein [Boletus edulis BED1]
MATALNRRPLGARQHLQQLFGNSPQKSRTPSAPVKRPRSPEPAGDAPKRVRATLGEPVTTTLPDEERKDKEQRRQAREAAKNEFRVKYTRAFPSWVFYFDLDQLDPDIAALRNSLVSRVTQLGARVEDFFSNEITHLITNQAITAEDIHSNKENARKLRGAARTPSLLKSPIKLKGRIAEDGNTQNFNIIEKAQAFDMKIWNTVKLDSILERCGVLAPKITKHPPGVQSTSTATTNQRNLTRLLASERLHGTTERDPTQKRHDFRYFSKSSYFVLVEDAKQELATLHALEYPIDKGRDGKERGAWPVLFCHPHSRGPFIEFDEKERRRWEKCRRAEEDKETERQRRAARELRRKKQAQAQLIAHKTGDLRRSVSMNNLHRQAANAGVEDFADLDADFPDTQASANASGYLASTSAYIAASGNSVGITSTTGTTSTGGALRALELPANLRGRLQQQVVTSRKVSTLVTGKDDSSRQPGGMGPPDDIPNRPNALLRKSRSTNTLRLPKRDEGSKPGYCESCRVKFDDFEHHIRDRKHRKFANDDSNYLQLDFVLNRVQRRTRQQYKEQEDQDSTRNDEQQTCSEDYPMCSSPPFMFRGNEEEDMWDGDADADGDVLDV